jgi:hypothetical protein
VYCTILYLEPREILANFFNNAGPISHGRLTKQSSGAVPRAVVSIQQPTPVSAKPVQNQYRIYHHKGEVLFIDSSGILYDKSARGGYVRCGILKNGEVEFD